MIKTIDPNAPKFSAEKIRAEVENLGQVCREAVKRELKGKYFSLTTDHWTSKNDKNYACLTAHWIDDGKCKWCVLHFETHKGSSWGVDLGIEFVEVFKKYGFDLSYVVAITTDTRGNMNTFGSYLQMKGVIHLYCIAHNLHLTGKLAFLDSNLPDSGNAMKMACSLVEYFTKSTQTLDNLKKMQETIRPGVGALKLLQDVQT